MLLQVKAVFLAFKATKFQMHWHDPSNILFILPFWSLLVLFR